MKLLIGTIKGACIAGFGVIDTEKLDIFIYCHSQFKTYEFTYEIGNKFSDHRWRINNIDSFNSSSISEIKKIQSQYLLKINREETLNQILNG